MVGEGLVALMSRVARGLLGEDIFCGGGLGCCGGGKRGGEGSVWGIWVCGYVGFIFGEDMREGVEGEGFGLSWWWRRDWVFDYLLEAVVRGNRCEEMDLPFLARRGSDACMSLYLNAVG